MDYVAALKVAAPIATWAIQTFIVRRLERRARLVGFITAAPAIHVRSVADPFWLHALVLIIRNEGRRVAKGVRIRHDQFPNDVSVYPNLGYEVKQNPQGMSELVLDDIVPGDQVTISYLYPNTMTVASVNPVLISDDGISPLTLSLPRRQPSPWLVGIRSGLAFLGATFLLYWIARAAISYIIGEPIVSPFH